MAGAQEDILKLENQLCFAVYACSREIIKLYRPILDELGLTYTQYVTMLALWEKDGVSVKELGGKLYLDSGTLTPLLKKMESMGLVTREREKSDERSVVITLTEKGANLKEKAFDVPAKLLCSAGFDAEEAAEVQMKVTKLLEQVQAFQVQE
ncbi:MarR family winged helix-turn-helix transcriptional regulator [Paenibacillus gansuensis]|uniref:MarR family winged helix-turn-helix transcriptional regulator n=1 Tax=Paenibacillus gansuensis TaxID=306542 RepID=A0ABW5PJ87_9BACL